MGLKGKRALVQDISRTREARIVFYPSEDEGDIAMVHFDGDLEPVSIHKTRVHKILAAPTKAGNSRRATP